MQLVILTTRGQVDGPRLRVAGSVGSVQDVCIDGGRTTHAFLRPDLVDELTISDDGLARTTCEVVR
ncbi:hypothetical protein ARC23_03135 [Stenotrophomonas beteli]|uniref:Uncharacterized protein n=1 Tax=Stenotrophomonas beteli TaxID=3384461 RepID=A0A0R0B3U7_9GAMM|nr:hypothetical protein ARC23_03135 [Stenotrophomonas maltophilia]